MDLGQLLADAIVRTQGENVAKWIKPDVNGGLTLDGRSVLKQIAETFLVTVRRAEKDESVGHSSPAPNHGIEAIRNSHHAVSLSPARSRFRQLQCFHQRAGRELLPRSRS